MDVTDDFWSILFLLKLEKLVRKRKRIKNELTNEILSGQKLRDKSSVLKNEKNINLDCEEIKNESVNNSRKNYNNRIFKKIDLMPSRIPVIYKPRTPSPNNEDIDEKIEFVFTKNSRNRSEMCDLCGVIIRRSNMEFHMNVHLNRKPFVCDYKNCRKSFSAPSTLFRHRKLHTASKEFTCDICSAKFHFNGNLTKHKTTHLEPKFKCTICDHMFKTNNRLKYHMYTHKESENLNCTFPSCDKKFKNASCVREHLRRFHNIKVRERVSR